MRFTHCTSRTYCSRTFLYKYSGGQNIVDTLFMFYLHALTLGENNFWSVKIVVLYLVCNWRLKCFPSISAIKISKSSFLTSWGSFLQTSAAGLTQLLLVKKLSRNLSKLGAEIWRNDPHEVKNEYIGWNRQKTFQSSITYQIQHHNFYRSKIIVTQS